MVGLTRAEQFSVIEISRNTSYLLFFFFSRTQFFWQCQIGLTYARRRNNNYVRLELYDVDVTGRFGITLLYLYMENTHETTGVEDGRMVSACTRLPEASVWLGVRVRTACGAFALGARTSPLREIVPTPPLHWIPPSFRSSQPPLYPSLSHFPSRQQRLFHGSTVAGGSHPHAQHERTKELRDIREDFEVWIWPWNLDAPSAKAPRLSDPYFRYAKPLNSHYSLCANRGIGYLNLVIIQRSIN